MPHFSFVLRPFKYKHMENTHYAPSLTFPYILFNEQSYPRVDQLCCVVWGPPIGNLSLAGKKIMEALGHRYYRSFWGTLPQSPCTGYQWFNRVGDVTRASRIFSRDLLLFPIQLPTQDQNDLLPSYAMFLKLSFYL